MAYNPATTMADQVRWFDGIGRCGGCGKQAHGKLMGPRNESYGAYCTRCAESRLAKAKKEQEAESLYRAKMAAGT